MSPVNCSLTAVRPLVLPVVEDERLGGRAVLEVELAACVAERARELRAWTEERRDEAVVSPMHAASQVAFGLNVPLETVPLEVAAELARGRRR